MSHVAPLCVAVPALTDLKGEKKDAFVLSNKIIQNDGHSCAALCHNGPDQPYPSRLTIFLPTIRSALIADSPPGGRFCSVFSFLFCPQRRPLM